MTYSKDKTCQEMTKQKCEHSGKIRDVQEEQKGATEEGGEGRREISMKMRGRQKMKTAGFSVLQVIYDSAFCLNELLRRLRGSVGKRERRVQ